MKTRYIIIASLFLLATAFVTATESPFITNLKAQLLSYLNLRNEEKVYVQTDKTLYKPGEYIFFNAFLTDASTGKPSRMSNIVYVELYDPKGNVSKKLKIHAQNGMAGGEFLIEDSQPGGLYSLKAYTSWMKNFGEDRFFNKEIQVQKVITPRLLLKPDFEKKAYGAGDEVTATLIVTDLKNQKANNATVKVKVNIEGKLYKEFTVYTNNEGKATMKFSLPAQLNSPDGLLQSIVSYQGVEESVSRSIPIVLNKISLKFYPEGGTWVAGISSRMAFEAINEFGKGADVSGEIIDENGMFVTNFESFHFGMGAFEMQAVAGKHYSARILKPEGTNTLFALPIAETQTHGMNVKNQDKKAIVWNIYSPDNQTAYIVAQVNGILYDSKTVELKGGLNAVNFDTQKLPAGVAVFTLFTSSGEPACERLIMVNSDKQLNINIKTDKEKYSPGEKVKAEIKTTDEKGNPVPAGLSLAVVDEQLLTMADDKQDNILTYLLLTSDLKGKIYEPSFYFDKKEEKSGKAIDYLLLTHGWRRFTWNDVRNSSLEKFPEPENIGRIYGFVKNKNEQPVKTEITLVELNNKKRVLKMNTRSDGRFAFYNVDPTATVALFTPHPNIIVITEKPVSFPSQSLVKNLDIEALLSAKTVTEIPGFVEDNHSQKIPRDMIRETEKIRKDFYILRDEPIEIKEDIMFNFEDEKSLQEVVVVAFGAQKKNNLTGSVSVIKSHEPINFARNLNLNGKIAGIIVRENSTNPSDDKKILIRGIASMGDGGSEPLIVVDGVIMPSRGNNISSYGIVNPSNISSIEILKGVAAYSIYGNRAANGVILISTHSGKNFPHRHKTIKEKPVYSSVLINPKAGVDISKSYYELAPRLEPIEGVRSDFRTTVYWKNAIVTDKSGKAEIEYYNNEATSAFRITAEGTSLSSGLIGRVEHTYSTQLPLSLDAKLPNYLSLGDTLRIPVSVRNNTKETLSPEIEIYVSGLQLLGESKVNPSIQPDMSQKLFFTVVSTGKTGQQLIEIILKDKQFKDEIKHQLDVISTGFPRSFSMSGKEPSRQATFNIQDIEPGSLKGTATLHISILDELFAGTASILREPCGCFEQVSSSTFPNIFVMQLMQATGQGDPALRQKALDYIKKGYDKLKSYEIPTGGFEWFGNPPANEALTAYGLIEFHEMNKVYDGVSKEMIERTKRYLLDRRNPDGTFIQTKGKFDRLSSAPYEVNCAYAIYALTETGVKDIEKAYKYSLNEAEKSGDMYRMALMSLAAHNLNKTDDYARLTSKFLKLFSEDTDKVETTIVSSGGKTRIVETISLWAVSLMRGSNPDWTAIEKCIQYIASNRGNYGYGSTQATSLSLKALTDYATQNTSNRGTGKMILDVNNHEYELLYQKDTKGSVVNTEFANNIKQGDNSISVLFSNEKSLYPYSVVLMWNARTPESSENCPLRLSTVLSQQKVKLNETVRLSVKLQNMKKERGQPMSMAVIGIPAGLTPQPWQLKELQEKGVFDYYEILNNRLAIYYRTLGTGETKSIELDLKADIPGKYTSAASSGYLYYQQEDRHWLKGLEVTIED